jgi:CheY-like chemotaxis protein
MSICLPPGRRPRLLLVEDRADIFELYRNLLSSLGYEVAGATDGEVAIEQAQRLLPDLIVMDHGLPKLDGCEATRRLKADTRTRHIPIVMVSGYVQAEVMARAAGCDAFFVKPLPLDRLVEEVRARLPALEEPASPPLVMIVEDDEAVRASLSEVLASEGLRTIEAEHGGQALDWLRRGVMPRLILLDLMMPVMDGWAFRDAQRGNPAWLAIPTVILSAVPTGRQNAARLQADGYLSKPVSLPLLMDTVERHGVDRHGV